MFRYQNQLDNLLIIIKKADYWLENRELFRQLFGKHLRAQRKAIGLITLEKLSEETNLDDKNIGKIERGTRLPSAHTLFKLYQSENISIDLIFEEIQKELS